MIVLNDPRVAGVPVLECGELLAEVRGVTGLALDPRERDAAGAYGRVRAGVLERLCQASQALPDGLGILVIEGHRSRSEQARRFSTYEDRLRQSGVTDPAERRHRASMFVSPVEMAPHCAGAAVDVTLTDADGVELDMGCEVNGHRSGHESLCPLDAPDLSDVAHSNRSLMARCLSEAGFVNYPSEWCSQSSSCVQTLDVSSWCLEGAGG